MSALIKALDLSEFSSSDDFFSRLFQLEMREAVINYLDNRYKTFSKGYNAPNELDKSAAIPAIIKKAERSNYC